MCKCTIIFYLFKYQGVIFILNTKTSKPPHALSQKHTNLNTPTYCKKKQHNTIVLKNHNKQQTQQENNNLSKKTREPTKNTNTHTYFLELFNK